MELWCTCTTEFICFTKQSHSCAFSEVVKSLKNGFLQINRKPLKSITNSQLEKKTFFSDRTLGILYYHEELIVFPHITNYDEKLTISRVIQVVTTEVNDVFTSIDVFWLI